MTIESTPGIPAHLQLDMAKVKATIDRLVAENRMLREELAEHYAVAQAARELSEAASQLEKIEDAEAALLINRLDEVIVRIRCSTVAARLEYLPTRLRKDGAQ